MKRFSWPYRCCFWLSSIFCKVGRGRAGSAWRGWGSAALLCVPSKGKSVWPDSLSSPLQNVKQGAIPVLYLSLAKELDGVSGKHFSSSCMITLPAKTARDPQVAQRLWDATVQLTNLEKMDWPSATLPNPLRTYRPHRLPALLWSRLLFIGSSYQSSCPRNNHFLFLLAQGHESSD